jgi:hypothetical protein
MQTMPPQVGDMGIPGLSVTEEPLSERGPLPMGQFMGQGTPRPETTQETVKKYTLTGKPETAEEQQQRELDTRQREVQNHKQQANSLRSSAMKYQMWAMQNPNKPAAQTLLAMSTQYEKQAKAAETTAKNAQKDLDDQRKIITEAEAEREVAEARAGADITSSQIEGQVELEKARREDLEAARKRYFDMLRQVDPERYEERERMWIMMQDPSMQGLFAPDYGPE